eukprot:PhM_4_TR17338/c0_g1_i1/m.100950
MLSSYDLRRNFKNGDSYNGQAIEDGIKHGKGTYVWSNGNKYTGMWKRDKMCGEGVFYNAANGYRHEGSFNDGKRSGPGTTFYNDGTIYRGSFIDNELHGVGEVLFDKSSDVDDKEVTSSCSPSSSSRLVYFKGNFDHGVISCPLGGGEARYSDGSTYTGPWRNGKWHTDSENIFGVWRRANGDVFEGHFEGGVPHKHGTWRFHDGTTYTGAIEAGEMHGYGEIEYTSTATTYVGWFHHGERHSMTPDQIGVMTSPTMRFEGVWVRGDLTDETGRAIIVSHDAKTGYTYKGKTKANKRHGDAGNCVWVAADKTNLVHVYDGPWRDDQMDGEGGRRVAKEKEGSEIIVWEYSGAHANDCAHGNGSMIHHREGWTYDGSWCHGVREGKGNLQLTSNGDTYKGDFSHDEPNGRGEWTFSDGRRYVGEVENGMRCGHGRLVWPNGNHYDGAWLGDERHGHGTQYTSSTGDSYTGEWCHDIQHGDGIEIVYGTHHYSGGFVSGKKCGFGKIKYNAEAKGIYEGYWRENLYNGKGHLETPELTYDGDFINGIRTGSGISIMHKLGGLRFEGQIRDGVHHGQEVTVLQTNGDTYRGNLVKGVRHGRGIVEFFGSGGGRLYATFVKDVLHGEAISCKAELGETVWAPRLYVDGVGTSTNKEALATTDELKAKARNWLTDLPFDPDGDEARAKAEKGSIFGAFPPTTTAPSPIQEQKPLDGPQVSAEPELPSVTTTTRVIMSRRKSPNNNNHETPTKSTTQPESPFASAKLLNLNVSPHRSIMVSPSSTSPPKTKLSLPDQSNNNSQNKTRPTSSTTSTTYVDSLSQTEKETIEVNIAQLDRDMSAVENEMTAPGLSEAKKFQLKKKFSLLRASRLREVRKLGSL